MLLQPYLASTDFIFPGGIQSEGVIKTVLGSSRNSHRQLAINNVRYSTSNGSTFFPSHKQVKVTFDMARFRSCCVAVLCLFFRLQITSDSVLFSARVDSMRLTEVNRKKTCICWRSGDLCLQSTVHKFHFIVLIKNPFDWKKPRRKKSTLWGRNKVLCSEACMLLRVI